MVGIGILEGNRIYLRKFKSNDITAKYISWLNDNEINKYSRRFKTKTTKKQAIKYLKSLKPDEVILAIIIKESKKHIGNIKFGPIDRNNKLADISILLGDKSEWGKGYAAEAIYLVTKYLFQLDLNRVEAGTVNPAFVNCVLKLGWKQEGVFRDGFFLRGKFRDVIRLSLLRKEFKKIYKFEK